MKFKYIILSFFAVSSIVSTPQAGKPTARDATVDSSKAQSGGSVLDIFKRSGYVQTLAALREMEDVLVKIDAMNKEILQKRKQQDAEIRQINTDLNQKIKVGETSLKKLRDDIQDTITRDIEDLKRRIASNEGNVKTLEAALKEESNLLSKAKTLNSWTLGYAQYAVDWASSAETARRGDLNKQIKKLQDEIAQWRKLITTNKDKMQTIFATAEFKKKQETIVQELDKAKLDLQQVVTKVTTLEKAIIADYSKPAEELIATLKKIIKKADCSTIKTIADAKPAIIKACKERYLARIKTAYPKVAECQRLTIDSSVADIKKCK